VVIASFVLFYIAEERFHLNREMIQTFMFLKLAVAGHLTIFITRTRSPFWLIAPAPILLWAAIGTKLLATAAAVYGAMMVPIGWKWSALIWGYAILWFFINDALKLIAYRILDPQKPSAPNRLKNVDFSGIPRANKGNGERIIINIYRFCRNAIVSQKVQSTEKQDDMRGDRNHSPSPWILSFCYSYLSASMGSILLALRAG
jgi:hypothetical protein